MACSALMNRDESEFELRRGKLDSCRRDVPVDWANEKRPHRGLAGGALFLRPDLKRFPLHGAPERFQVEQHLSVLK